MIAQTPKPPYYAVIFSSIESGFDANYERMAKRMVELASLQDGFLGIESAREAMGISVSYWRSLEAIKQWKVNADHQLAQKQGQELWYKHYKTRIALVQTDYSFDII